MKKVILAVVIFATIGTTISYSQEKKAEVKSETALSTTTFGVRGNCGMCKKTIEKAANSVEGVSKAVWHKEHKSISVAYDESKTTAMAVQNAIADSGYDTEKVMGNKKAYSNLPGCCKYDHSMKMNQGNSKKTKKQTKHSH